MDYNLKILLNYICELNDHFWRSCDSEDWSNDAENAALATGINDILNRNVYFNFKNIAAFAVQLKQLQWAEETSIKNMTDPELLKSRCTI